MTARLILTTKALLFSLPMTLTIHAAEWEPLPSLPEPNGGCMCGAANGKIVIVGGTKWEGGTKHWLGVVRMYEPARKQWSSVSGYDYPVAYGVSFQLSEASFGFAGGSDGKEPFRVIGSADGSHASFLKAPRMPDTIVLAAGGHVNGQTILVGGTNDAANIAGVTRLTHAIQTSSVTKLADCPGKPFAVAASAVVGAELFLFGGMNFDEDTKAPLNSSEAFAFSPEKNAWRKLKPLAVASRGMAAVPLDEQHIYIAGGYTDSFTSSALIYDVKADSYRAATPLAYAAMVGLVKLDGFVYCIGGEDKMKSRTDKFLRIPVAELLR